MLTRSMHTECNITIFTRPCHVNGHVHILFTSTEFLQFLCLPGVPIDPKCSYSCTHTLATDRAPRSS